MNPLDGLPCPRCPMCGQPPDDAGMMMALITGGGQVVCSTESCRVFMWDATLPDGGLSSAEVIPDEPDPDGVTRPRPASAEEVAQALDEQAGTESGRQDS